MDSNPDVAKSEDVFHELGVRGEHLISTTAEIAMTAQDAREIRRSRTGNFRRPSLLLGIFE
jgi:hypothetical protein